MVYDNENKGALFKNKNKETDKHPDYKGSINIAGTEYWLSSYINTAKETNEKYMSLYATPKEEKVKPSPVKKKDEWTGKSESEIPF